MPEKGEEMTKNEALEKATGYTNELLSKGFAFRAYHDTNLCRFVVSDLQFPYDPPREAPPKGTIVEVWDDPEKKYLQFSRGFIKNDRLYTCDTLSNEGWGNAFKHWRVVETGERVPTLGGMCCTCKHTAKYSNEEPCKECVRTIPSNYEAKK